MSKRSLTARLLALGLIALLLASVAMALPRGVADVYGYLVQSHIDAWRERGREPDDAEWQVAAALFESALEWTPGDPKLLQQGARLYEWGAIKGNAERARRSLELYRASLQRRPAWPYAWADLAAAKVRFGEIDDELQQALANALQLGPWEPEVQLAVAQAGLGAFSQLTRENRAALAQNIKRAAQVQPEKIVQLADAYGYRWLACSLGKEQPRIARACKSARK